MLKAITYIDLFSSLRDKFDKSKIFHAGYSNTNEKGKILHA